MAALCALVLPAATGCARSFIVKSPAPEEIETTLFLIGDAGEPDPRQPSISLDSMRRQAAEAPERSIVVFLGDNVYPDGVPLDSTLTWADSRRRLTAQIDAVPPGARGIFLPGNHDWSGEGAYGLYAVRLQEKMINSLAHGRDIRMLPGNGCPGPVAVDTGRLRFIALDTQWWLHEGPRPLDPTSSCGGTQEQYSSGKLDRLIVNKVKLELAAVDADPLRIAGVGKDESSKPCNERIVMAY